MSAENVPIRIGILGFGKIATKRFLPAASVVETVEITAIGTSRPQHAIQDARALGKRPITVSYAELVERGRDLVDAVYIALPNHLHFEWAQRAAEAGLHVLCEKPLGANVARALQCREAFANRSLILCEAFMYRHDPRHARVRRLCEEGAIGRVHLVEALFSYVLEDFDNIRLQAASEGGALMDVGCYGIDVARFLLGEEPNAVSASGVRGARSGVDELTVTTLHFPSGAMAVATASTQIARAHVYRVRGTDGTICVPAAFVPRDDEPTTVIVARSDGSKATETFPPFAVFEEQLRHFARCVVMGELSSPAEDGVETARILEQAGRCLVSAPSVDLHRGRSVAR